LHAAERCHDRSPPHRVLAVDARPRDRVAAKGFWAAIRRGLAEWLGLTSVISFDADFAIYRFGPRRDRAFDVRR
jgi:hypothetical protein